MLKFVKSPKATKDAKWLLSYSADIKNGNSWKFECGWKECNTKGEVKSFIKLMEAKQARGEVREFEYEDEVVLTD